MDEAAMRTSEPPAMVRTYISGWCHWCVLDAIWEQSTERHATNQTRLYGVREPRLLLLLLHSFLCMMRVCPALSLSVSHLLLYIYRPTFSSAEMTSSQLKLRHTVVVFRVVARQLLPSMHQAYYTAVILLIELIPAIFSNESTLLYH